VFGQAKNRLTATGRDLHSLYEQERRAMMLQ
jgi:hypothetical protein